MARYFSENRHYLQVIKQRTAFLKSRRQKIKLWKGHLLLISTRVFLTTAALKANRIDDAKARFYTAICVDPKHFTPHSRYGC